MNPLEAAEDLTCKVAALRCAVTEFSWKNLWAFIRNTARSVKFQRKTNRLHLRDTLPLGEKRFLATVDWEGETLLLGVTPQSITLLRPKQQLAEPSPTEIA